MRNQHGKAGRRLLIFVVIVGLAVWVLFSLLPTWYRAQQFKDHVKNLAGYAGSYPFTQDDVMADSMARAAKDAGVPELTKEYFLRSIQRGQGTLRVKVQYTRESMLLGTSYKLKSWDFSFDIQERYAGF
jgi:hypothetical protein